VVPLDFNPTRSTLVLFEPVAETIASPDSTPHPVPEGDVLDRHISQLNQQLADAKERFLSSIEAHQTSCEESQNATEEALSANEELQSLNEELETAKEELQSTNEELITLNNELQTKNAALAQARDFAMSIVETIRQPLVVLDTDLRVKMANKSFYRSFQISPLEAEGQIVFSLSHGSWDLPGLRGALDGLLRGGNSFPDFEVQKDFMGLGSKSLIVGGCHLNHLKMILLAVDDITEHKLAQQALRRSEDHLRQAQKMEAVGRLAGGIAHDFNNRLLVESVAGNEPAMQQVGEIRKAGERAASLTKQLLAYSRRQVLQPKVLDLNSIVADLEKMLRRLVGERITVNLNCEPALWQVRADPGEIGRAILNLSLNARDAMPEGGTLTIATTNLMQEVVDDTAEPAPGRYAVMAVHDTGLGINAEVRAHIFEPFYTTKTVGKGTGLGLATVLGIVEQSGGVIHCESALGEGTTFKIFLPAVAEPVDPVALPIGGPATMPKGCEVILLVEDEEMVRVLTRQILTACGYTVIECSNGREGLDLCKTHEGPIDLLVCDVAMPVLNGRELAEGALKLRPGLKIMFTSGHTEDIVLKEGIKKGTAFLHKPFLPVALAQKVRATLDSATRSIETATIADS
jgi:nitrogen-specific signal transduction histidine kinase/ActR/RegA family two-component response regulator